MKRKHRKRKQPRRLTPPLVLRNDDGERELIEVDQTLTTSEIMRSGRVRALLVLAPGLRVEIGSRSVNKRRLPVITIAPQGWRADDAPQPGATFRAIAKGADHEPDAARSDSADRSERKGQDNERE